MKKHVVTWCNKYIYIQYTWYTWKMCSRCIHNSEHANGSQILVSQDCDPAQISFCEGLRMADRLTRNALIKAFLKQQWGTNLWAGSWTGMVVERKTPPINSFRIYPPKKHISHILTYPYMPWYLFYLFNLLCYVWWRIPQVRVQTPSNVRRFFCLFVVTAIFVPGLLESLRKQGWLLWLVWCGKCLLSPGRGGRRKTATEKNS